MHTEIVDAYLDDDEDSVSGASVESSVDDKSSTSTAEHPDEQRSSFGHTIPQSVECDAWNGRGSSSRANRATFGLFDSPTKESTFGSTVAHASRFLSRESDSSCLEDVVDDVNDMIESFRPSLDSSESFACRGHHPQSEGKRARRGGFYAREDNAVNLIVNASRPNLTRRPSSAFAVFDEDVDYNERISPVPSSVVGGLLRSDERSRSSDSPEIGVAILSREEIALLESEIESAEAHLKSAFSSSSESDYYDPDDGREEDVSADLHDSPFTLPCRPFVVPFPDDRDVPSTPSPDFELGDLSSSFDRLQSSLSKLRATHSPSRERSVDLYATMRTSASASTSMSMSLKPALRILSTSGANSINSSSTGTGTPSPSTPSSLLPPPSPGFAPGQWGMGVGEWGAHRQSVPMSPTMTTFSSSRTIHVVNKDDAATTCPFPSYGPYGTPPVPSFMHLTPNESAQSKQRRRGRFRSLFSRSANTKK